MMGPRTGEGREDERRTYIRARHLDHAPERDRHRDGARAVLGELVTVLAADLEEAVVGAVLVLDHGEEVADERVARARDLVEVGTWSSADGAPVAVVVGDGEDGGREGEGDDLERREVDMCEAGLQVGHGAELC